MLRRILLFSISCYRTVLSPFLGSHCRYYPSCSNYAQQSILRFGVIRGGWMAICRLGRCHPWHEGGYDPVPGDERSLPCPCETKHQT